jgi:hypothetical protein
MVDLLMLKMPHSHTAGLQYINLISVWRHKPEIFIIDGIVI